MCLYPKLMDNPKYKVNKTNGGQVPPLLDQRASKVPVPCGKCMECSKKKARDWSIRLKEEIRWNGLKGEFMTYTFSPEAMRDLAKEVNSKNQYELDGYDLDNAIAGLALRRYTELWRKHNKKALRHWIVSEIGGNGTERIHLHGICWYDPEKHSAADLVKHWKYGIADVGEKGVYDDTIGYIVKYLYKQDGKHKEYQPKMWVSKGIGLQYLKRDIASKHKYDGEKTNEIYRSPEGYKMGLPNYYRKKLFDDDERESLWMKKLDEQVRWVNGVKIDVSTEEGMRNYEKRLQQEQAKNKRLGYGDGTKDWNRLRYERANRNLKKELELKRLKLKEQQTLLRSK